MTATEGRIVHFKHDTQTAAWASGNSKAGDVVPAIIVKAWADNYVNLKVFTDGPNDIWVTSVFLADASFHAERQWQWPNIIAPTFSQNISGSGNTGVQVA